MGGSRFSPGGRPEKLNLNNIQIMNTTTVKGDWNVAKGKLKQKYGQLTDNDLTYQEGKTDELVGRIQKRVGQTRDEVQRAVDDAFKSNP